MPDVTVWSIVVPLLPLLAFLVWASSRFFVFCVRARRRGSDEVEAGSVLLPGRVRQWYGAEAEPIVRWLARRGVRPNHLTWAGTGLSALAAVAFALGLFAWGGYAMLLGGVLDTFDGRVARATGHVSTYGAFLDSTLDRYADMLVFAGLTVAYRESWVALLPLFAMLGCVTVSYARARAEGLGISCRKGLMQRPERVVLVGFAAVLEPSLSLGVSALLGAPGSYLLPLVLAVVAVLAHGTASARIHTVYRELNPKPAKDERGAERRSRRRPYLGGPAD